MNERMKNEWMSEWMIERVSQITKKSHLLKPLFCFQRNSIIKKKLNNSTTLVVLSCFFLTGRTWCFTSTCTWHVLQLPWQRLFFPHAVRCPRDFDCRRSSGFLDLWATAGKSQSRHGLLWLPGSEPCSVKTKYTFISLILCYTAQF